MPPAKPYTAPPYYPHVPVADPSAKAIPIRAYYQTRAYTCGFASALTVLHGFRKRVDPEDLYWELGTDKWGTSQTAIVRALRNYGVSAAIRYDLTFERLARAIDQHKLIIGYHHRLEHWVVVYGYGRDPERVFVADSLINNRSEHTWAKYGPKMRGFGIVCKPRRARSRRLTPRAVPIPLVA